MKRLLPLSFILILQKSISDYVIVRKLRVLSSFLKIPNSCKQYPATGLSAVRNLVKFTKDKSKV